MTVQHGRQYAATLDGIRDDHVARYRFAAQALQDCLNRGDGVVDAGAGCGYGSHILADRGGFEVLAIESDQEANAYAARYWAHPRVERVTRDLESGARDALGQWFTGRKALVAFEVIEHLADPLHMLKLAADFGIPTIVGSVPNQAVLPFDPARHKYHFRHYDAEQLTSLLAQAGYRATWLGGQRGKRGDDATVGNNIEGAMTLVFIAWLARAHSRADAAGGGR